MRLRQKTSAEQGQIEVQTSEGKSLAVACKEAEISEQRYCHWRREHDGLQVDQINKMKDLERENARLRRLVADLSRENQMLANVATGKLSPPSDAGRRWTTSRRSMVSPSATPVGSPTSTAAHSAQCRPYRPTRMPSFGRHCVGGTDARLSKGMSRSGDQLARIIISDYSDYR